MRRNITKTIMNNPNIHQPSHRKRLNQEQLAVLQLLYIFRFATSIQIARFSNKRTQKLIQKRLTILEEQDLIAKRYDKTYKLQGKPAAYYIQPHGARILAQYDPMEADEPIDFKRIYKNKQVSENFIAHCVIILDLYLLLKDRYAQLRFFTKTKLHNEKYDYFPEPCPDSYMRINEHRFFTRLFDEGEPFFVLVRAIKQYIQYAEGGDWDETGHPLPGVLFICANSSMQKRIHKRIVRELQESSEEITFATTTLSLLVEYTARSGEIWLSASEYSNSSDESPELLDLESL